MGTSSILAGAIISVLWTISGKSFDKLSVVHAVSIQSTYPPHSHTHTQKGMGINDHSYVIYMYICIFVKSMLLLNYING